MSDIAIFMPKKTLKKDNIALKNKGVDAMYNCFWWFEDF